MEGLEGWCVVFVRGVNVVYLSTDMATQVPSWGFISSFYLANFTVRTDHLKHNVIVLEPTYKQSLKRCLDTELWDLLTKEYINCNIELQNIFF